MYISIRCRSAHVWVISGETKGLRDDRCLTEETGLVGGSTSLKALWNRKSLTLKRRFKWYASGSVLPNYFKMTLENTFNKGLWA